MTAGRDWLAALAAVAVGGPAVARPRPRSVFEPQRPVAVGGPEAGPGVADLLGPGLPAREPAGPAVTGPESGRPPVTEPPSTGPDGGIGEPAESTRRPRPHRDPAGDLRGAGPAAAVPSPAPAPGDPASGRPFGQRPADRDLPHPLTADEAPAAGRLAAVVGRLVTGPTAGPDEPPPARRAAPEPAGPPPPADDPGAAPAVTAGPATARPAASETARTPTDSTTAAPTASPPDDLPAAAAATTRPAPVAPAPAASPTVGRPGEPRAVAAASDRPPAAPVVRISIGRVEVRAVLAPGPAVAERPEPARVAPPLEEYLADPRRFR